MVDKLDHLGQLRKRVGDHAGESGAPNVRARGMKIPKVRLGEYCVARAWMTH